MWLEKVKIVIRKMKRMMMMSLYNNIELKYLTVSKSYSDNCTCSLTEQNTILKNLYYGLIQM